MRLKRWESPRREGRNDKGKGGSARKRQLKKQRQMLRQRLKENNKPNNNENNQGRGEKHSPLFFWLIMPHSKVLRSHCVGRLCRLEASGVAEYKSSINPAGSRRARLQGFEQLTLFYPQ
jgi:hypothetical protein